jgi:hypothetical protein
MHLSKIPTFLCEMLPVPDMRGQGQPACPRVQKKYEERVK